MGSKKFGFPVPVTRIKQLTFAVKWILKFFCEKRKRKFKYFFIDYFLSIFKKSGNVYEQKINFYKIASENRHLIKRYR